MLVLYLTGSDLGRRLSGLTLPHLRHLDLSSMRHLSDASLTAFLRCAPNIESLELCSAPFLFSSSYLYADANARPNSAALTFNRFLLEVSRSVTTLHSLNLSRTSISNGALETLAKVPDLRLHRLGLSSCKDLTDSGVVALSLAQRHLRELDLSSNAQLTSISVKHIVANLSKLDYLNLTKIRLHPKETPLLQKMGSCSKLVLSASILEWLPAREAELIAQVWCPRLRSLDMSFCTGLGSATLITICHYLGNLTELNLSSCFRLDDLALREISRSLVNLTSLSVSWCKLITDLGLLGVYHPDFNHDCTKDCKCDRHRDRDAPYFECQPPVKDIAPRVMIPTADDIKSVMAQHGELGRFPISRLSNLRSLNLSVCSKVTDRSVAEVLAFPGLRSLDLSMCSSLTDRAVIAIAAHNPLLERVSLAQCRGVTDRGVSALLSGCRRLVHLDLSNCSLLTDSTLHSLVKGKTRLRGLDISLCNLSIEAIDLLERLVPTLQTVHKRYTSAQDAIAR